MLKICKEGTLLGLNSVEGGHVVQYVKGGDRTRHWKPQKAPENAASLRKSNSGICGPFPRILPDGWQKQRCKRKAARYSGPEGWHLIRTWATRQPLENGWEVHKNKSDVGCEWCECQDTSICVLKLGGDPSKMI